jgi:fibronectin type 3 domain-containing protein
VLRSADGITFAPLVKLTGASVNSFTDSTVQPFHTYSYQVEGFTGTIISPMSNAASASTPLAIPANLTASVKGPSSIQLTWADSDPSALGYYILRSTDGVNFSLLTMIASGKTLTYTDAVSSDTTYGYQVEAFNGNATSAVSNTSTVTTPLFAPTAFSGTVVSGTSIQLSWTDNDANATGYTLQRSTDGVHFITLATLTSGTTNAYTDSTVISGHFYYYQLQAYNGAVTSAMTPKITLNTPLAAPSGMTTTVKSATSVQLSWTDNDPNAANYLVLRSSDGVTFTPLVKLTGANVNAYTDNVALPFHNYSYEVEGFTGTIISSVSNSAGASTPLAVPVNLTASVKGPSSIQLTWADSDPSALGYYILRSTDGVNFTPLTTIISGKTLTYTDATVLSDATYSYQLQAFNGNATSPISNTATATTPLMAPSGVSAAIVSGSIQLSWTDNDARAAGYTLQRSTDGVHFVTLATLTSGTANAYTDSGVVSGHIYYYQLQAYNGTVTSAMTPKITVATPLAAPSGMTALAKSATSIQLSWTVNDPNVANYLVLRSTDGVTFVPFAKLTGASVNSFTDNAALSGHSYSYEVEGFTGTIISNLSNVASVVTPLLAPSNVVLGLQGAWVKVTWKNNDPSATGYKILRSGDGVTFTQIGQVTSATTTSYVDNTVVGSQTYYYQVQAYNSATASGVSSAVSMTVPIFDPSGHVAITTRYGSELVITATGSNDAISVVQSGTTLTLTLDGQPFTDPVPANGLFLYTRGGADTINIDSSVTVRTTVETIDGASTMITSGGSNVSAWMDSTDTFTGSGVFHAVASFMGNVSKAIGAALANPSDAGVTTKVNLSLWGSGPVASDVNQGAAGDCYFLSSLAAFAGETPAKVQESAVDMGDGTYTVQFYRNNAPVYVRVSNDISTSGGGYVFARPGANNTIWAIVMEKAFAYFRTGANTYNSINSGWMGEVYTDFGVASTNFTPSAYSEMNFYNLLSTALAANKPVTFGTQNAPNLVHSHAYTLISVSIDGSGVTHYVVRNPWGVAGDALEDSHGYVTLTFAQMVANFVSGCVAT